MKAIALTTAAVVTATLSASAASSTALARATQCGSGLGPAKYSATETIEGKSVVVNCGPATAKLQYKGETYVFTRGTCFRYLGSFKLNLGRSLLVPSAAGKSGYSSMTITAEPNGQAEVAAAAGTISLYVTAKFSGAAVKGTFSSLTTGVPATGSWNCGGPIHRS